MANHFIVSAEEINCLIHAYFVDSGFQHSAYVLSKEGQLDKSPLFRKHVPYGTLVDLLGKAMLYVETEAHWQGTALTRNCTTGFSLLHKHVCALDPALPETVTLDEAVPADEQPQQAPQFNGLLPAESIVKRKASTPFPDHEPREKRQRTDPLDENMELDSIASSADGKVNGTKTTFHIAPTDTSSTLAPQSGADGHPNTAKPLKSSPSSDPLSDHNVTTMLKGHKTEVFVCTWNPADKNLLASGSRDAIVNIWEVPLSNSDPDAPKHAIDPPVTFSYCPHPESGDLTSLDWSPDGSLLAVGSYDAILRVCTASGDLYFSHPQHDGPIFATRFSKTGRWLLTASLDGSACVWDVRAKRLHQQFKCHAESCLDVDWISEDAFVTCGTDGTIQIRRINPPAADRQLVGHMSEVNQIKCNPRRTRVASCSDDHTARIWNIEDILYGHLRTDESILLSGHTSQVSCVEWSPVTPEGEHEVLATASFDGSSRLWDSVTGDCLKTFRVHTKSVYSICFSPDGRFYATCGADGWVNVHDVRARAHCWSWNTGSGGGCVFELDWQQVGKMSRLALALESRRVAVLDLTHVLRLS